MRVLTVLALLFCFSSHSFAMSPSEVERSYNSCMLFLKMSPTKQRQVAARSGYSLETVTWACEYQRDQGLERMQWCEIRYQHGHRHC